jgi:S-adenosyl-L-methionine hydrolase (adenosine-forming)
MTVASGIVTLLTDFGQREPFVGVMKGVMLGRHPGLTFVDLMHDVPAHDIAFASFWLGNAAPWFPPGTVHLCVVDPGVGTNRRALVAECGEQWFVAPDNGVLSAALAEGGARVYNATVPEGASRTFHGRDVFAPLAADLAGESKRPGDVGPIFEDWARISHPVAARNGERIRGVVMVVDHFGNLISNIRLASGARGRVRVGAAGLPTLDLTFCQSYSEAGLGAALVNAWGLLEIAVARGRAGDVLGFGVGAWIEIEFD